MSIFYLATLVFIASTFGTVSGFGISTMMIPVLSLFYPISSTLLFVAIIHLCGDIWKIIFFKKGANWRLIATFGIPGIVMSYWGASLTLDVPGDLLKRLLGVFLILYVVYLFNKKRWRVRKTSLTSVLGGSLSGFFAGIFGVGGAIRGAFLSVYDLPKAMYLFTAGMIAFFVDVTRISKYVSGGIRLEPEWGPMLILLIPLSFLGGFVGKKWVDRVPQQVFRLVIAVFLGVVGLKFLIYP